jgi:hypothetical protein
MPTDSLVIKRHFKAPPERVFAAFTERSLMQAWYGPENMTVPHCDVDARVGGKYRVEMHSPAGVVHIVTVEFREIRPPEASSPDAGLRCASYPSCAIAASAVPCSEVGIASGACSAPRSSSLPPVAPA